MAIERYIKCPRCEINYILEKQKLCDVCKAELKLAPDIYSEDDEDMILCPICKQNYIFPDEEMCSTCKEHVEEPLHNPDDESDEQWRAFLDDEQEAPLVGEDGVEILSLNQMEDDESDEKFDDEEEVFEVDDYPDDFDVIDDFSDEEDEFDEEEDDDFDD